MPYLKGVREVSKQNEKEKEKIPCYSKNTNPTYFYLELINSILADILDDKHSETYGYKCAFIIYSAYMERANRMIIDFPGEESIINTIEIYTTMSYITTLYERKVKEGIIMFPRLPSSWMLTHLNFDNETKKWRAGITRANSAGKPPIQFGCCESTLLAAIEKVVDFANQTEKERANVHSND